MVGGGATAPMLVGWLGEVVTDEEEDNHTRSDYLGGGDFGWALGDGGCYPQSLGLRRLTGYPFFASFFYQLLPESMDYIRAAPLPHVTPSLPWCCSI